jgi:hypothetical protein
MKKIILLGIVLFITTISIYAKFIDNETENKDYYIFSKTKDNNIIAFPNSTSVSNKSIYILFTTKKDINFKGIKVEECYVKYTKSKVTFNTNEGEIYNFEIDTKTLNKTYSGYGILKLEDATLIKELNDLSNSGLINFNPEINYSAICVPNATPPGNECNCSGGLGATECSCSGGIASASWGSSVSCGSGTYACCSAKIIKNPIKGSSLSNDVK